MNLTRTLRAALSLKGMTTGDLARTLDPPVSDSMVHAVAAGRKKSDRVAAAIEETIHSAGLGPAPDRAPARGRSASA